MSDASTKEKATDTSAHDTRKRHGDKLGVAGGGGGRPANDRPGTGDSPKRQGDPMEKVLRSDAKG